MIYPNNGKMLKQVQHDVIFMQQEIHFLRLLIVPKLKDFRVVA